jgi:hypothetical protein
MKPSDIRHRTSMLGLASFATFAVAVGYSPLTSAEVETTTIRGTFSERPVLLATSVVTHSAVSELTQKMSDSRMMMFVTQITPEQALAEHLTQMGARMYGAYWCPYCMRQQELFGSAFDQIDYVECDARGENPQPQLCIDAGIQGFPTWEVNGELYPGLRSLEELATLSGYTGSTDFSN